MVEEARNINMVAWKAIHENGKDEVDKKEVVVQNVIVVDN